MAKDVLDCLVNNTGVFGAVSDVARLKESAVGVCDGDIVVLGCVLPCSVVK